MTPKPSKLIGDSQQILRSEVQKEAGGKAKNNHVYHEYRVAATYNDPIWLTRKTTPASGVGVSQSVALQLHDSVAASQLPVR